MQVRLSAEQLLRVILAEVDDVVIDLLRKRLDPGQCGDLQRGYRKRIIKNIIICHVAGPPYVR